MLEVGESKRSIRPLEAFSLALILINFVGYASASVKRCRQNSSDTTFIDNGYEGLLIHVGEEVEEDYGLIKDLQDLLTATSKSMFQATNRRAYIRQVKILLPRSWGDPPTEMAKLMKSTDTVYSKERGYFRLKYRSPKSTGERVSWKPGDKEAQIDLPYVIKQTPCGYSGRYLRMTPEFLRFGKRKKAVDTYGKQDKVVLRQWAKLRWGVYDEVLTEDYPSNFYIHTDRKTNPVTCSRGIPGTRVKSDDSTRDCWSDDVVRDKKCEFQPSESSTNGVTYASLMYRTDRDYIDYFCDNSDIDGLPPQRQHNSEAPTVHNLHCQAKSVWEVMREHPDFENGTNLPLAEDFVVPPVQISLFQNPVRRIVLVLDVSTSMELFDRLKLVRQAASQLIEMVPEKSWIGIVSFAVQAHVRSYLMEINSNEDRQYLKKRLPSETTAGTSIGSGIRFGLKVLKTSGPKHMPKSGGTMLVLSDGKEHNSPKIKDVIDEVRNFGVRINTIAFGNQVSEDLETLAEVTGGASYFASSGEFADNSELRTAFLATIENEEDDSVVVSSGSVRIPRNSVARYSFTIDERVGNTARITVLYTDPVAPKVGIKYPSGKVVWEDDPVSDPLIQFSSDAEFSTKVIQYNGEMATGIWRVLLKNQRLRNAVRADVTVFSRPGNNNESLVLSPALLCRHINFTGSESIVIYAHLSIGEFAVLDADVEAVVTRPLTSSGMYDTATVALKDDGRGADVIADDGIYSGYFTSFTLEGRYNVKVKSFSFGRARIAPDYLLGIGRLRERPLSVDTTDITDKSFADESRHNSTNNEVKSRKKRAINFGVLPPFFRESSEHKEVVLDNSVAVVCPSGYQHFQDSCYRLVNYHAMSAKAAEQYCESQGGYLARANSNQEYNYLLENVRRGSAWFGGIDKSLKKEQTEVIRRVRRQSGDDDLIALAEVFAADPLSEDMKKAVESFEPDWQGLSRKEINRIIRTLGISSASEIETLKESKLRSLLPKSYLTTAASFTRRKRQISLTVSSGDGEIEIGGSGDETTVTTTSQSATLAQAVKEPDKAEYGGSGENLPECSWISNEDIFQTSGDSCRQTKAFYCERPKYDVVRPSRINDFQLVQDLNDSQILRFSWTATGDDATFGKAARYDVRSLRTPKARILRNNFELGELIVSEAIMEGAVNTPKQSGEREELIVNQSKISACPTHAAVDLVLVLPQRLFEAKQSLPTERDGVRDMITTLVNAFKISDYEIQVTMVVAQNEKGYVVLQDSTKRNQILKALRKEVDSNEDNLVNVLEKINNAGRFEIPKLAIAVMSNEDLETSSALKQATQFMNVVVVAVGVTDKNRVQGVVREPVCENAIFADGWRGLNSSVSHIARQICRARADEYQAWGIIAVDEEGLKGPPSNIISSVIRNSPEHVECPEEATQLPQVAAGGSNTIALAITIPLAAILAVIGSFMLFGQVRKYRRKKRLEKERKAKEAEDAARNEKGPQASQSTGSRSAGIKSNKTAPISQPPV